MIGKVMFSATIFIESTMNKTFMNTEDLRWIYFHVVGNPTVKRIMEGDMEDCEKISTEELMDAISELSVLADGVCKYIDEICATDSSNKIAHKFAGRMQHHLTHEYCNLEVAMSALERGKCSKLDPRVCRIILVHDFNSCIEYLKNFIDGKEPNTIRLYDEKRYMSKFIGIAGEDGVSVKRAISVIEVNYEKTRLADTIERTGDQLYKDMLAELESGKYDKYVILEN